MIKRCLNLIGVLALALMALGPLSARIVSADDGPQGNLFVKQAGSQLRVNGKVFRFAGTNNYYLMYKSRFMVDDVLETAAENGFRVLRTWGSYEIGGLDGSNTIQGPSDGVYFQYWDPNAGRPAYNDGPDGLQRLDYVIAKAGQQGIRLVIPFVNNWNNFGGMDQYVSWRNGQYHDQFYTDPLIRQWYKDWMAHLLNRTNTITGVQYKDDPTIMGWELGNEPRCLSAGKFPRSSDCTTTTLVNWADEMSTFIKSIDDNHLVSVGDEGFFCVPGSTDWTENCGEGVDTVAFTRLPNIDIMSFHLYPDHWGKDAAWGTQWIQRHFEAARALNKPAMLGEYGWQDAATRNPVFKQWTDAVFASGGSGALYWILSGYQDDGTLYPDYDGFTVYCPSPVCTALNNFARMMNANRVMVFNPVADHDTVVTEFNTPATLNPPANDIAYGGAVILAATLDLDPSSAGQQASFNAAGGTFAAQPGGEVLFTPLDGFAGTAQASYTIQDSAGRTSNAANLSVTVKPDPTAAIQLFSFESGTEGWGPASWDPHGTVAQSGAFASDGAYSLQVDSTGGWFGVAFASPVNLSGKSLLKYDVYLPSAGMGREVAFQVGDGWTWCEGGGWQWFNGGQTVTMEVDLYNLSCANADLSDVRGMFIWFHGGTFYVDHIRAE